MKNWSNKITILDLSNRSFVLTMNKDSRLPSLLLCIWKRILAKSHICVFSVENSLPEQALWRFIQLYIVARVHINVASAVRRSIDVTAASLMWKHTGVKPFACHQCTAKLTDRRRSLKWHTILHLGIEKFFTCEVCGRSFPQFYTLQQHKTKVHARTLHHVTHFNAVIESNVDIHPVNLLAL